MPGFDGTGPQPGKWSNERQGGFGKCRTVDAPAQESAVPVQKANEGSEPTISQGSAQNIPVYGRGQGCMSFGCGRGNGFGGGRRPRV